MWRSRRGTTQPASVELDDARREPLEKGPVDVEMIRRLVEQEQVGLSDQRARQQHAPPPPARERVHDRGRVQAEPRTYLIHQVLVPPRLVGFGIGRMTFGDDVEDGAVDESGTSCSSRAMRTPG
jgi:hypothetical protein